MHLRSAWWFSAALGVALAAVTGCNDDEGVTPNCEAGSCATDPGDAAIGVPEAAPDAGSAEDAATQDAESAEAGD